MRKSFVCPPFEHEYRHGFQHLPVAKYVKDFLVKKNFCVKLFDCKAWYKISPCCQIDLSINFPHPHFDVKLLPPSAFQLTSK